MNNIYEKIRINNSVGEVISQSEEGRPIYVFCCPRILLEKTMHYFPHLLISFMLINIFSTKRNAPMAYSQILAYCPE
jgi:hypothetical protein